MTDQEVKVFLEYLKNHYPEIYRETMNHVNEFTDYMDNQLQLWFDMRTGVTSRHRDSFPPSLTKLKIGSADSSTDTISEWLKSPTPNRANPELLTQLAQKGFI